MSTCFLTIYLQNWKAISRKSITTAYEAAVRKLFNDVIEHQQSCDDKWHKACVESVEYIPNYSTPTDYSDYLNDNAWTLWSAARIAIRIPDNLAVDAGAFERQIAKSVSTNVHLEVEEQN